MGRGMRSGPKKVDELEFNDLRYQIDFKRDKDGEDGFFILMNERGLKMEPEIKARTLKELRRKALEHLSSTLNVTFHPVIVVTSGFGTWRSIPNKSEHHLPFSYNRYFRATCKDGRSVWKLWIYPDVKEKIILDNHEPERPEEDRLDIPVPENGTISDPLRDDGFKGKSHVFPYTGERWKTLRRLTKAVVQVAKRMIEMLGEDRVVQFLDNAASINIEFKGGK